MSELNVMFAGLPSSGKTSYLAILYQAMVDGKAGAFELSAYGEDDRVFVNEISARILAGEPAVHTEVDDKEEVSLSSTAHDKVFRLRVPDLGGEVWDHALADRRWVRDLDDRIADAVGYLVFVHAVDVEKATTIAQKRKADELLAPDDDEDTDRDKDTAGDGHGADRDEQVDADKHDAGSDAAAQAGNDEAADGHANRGGGDGDGASASRVRVRQTQVAVVDLIQLLEKRHRAFPVRVSIVVSAWDRIRSDITPNTWLHTNLPLLEQYLRHNSATIDASVWGISAQGGRFDRKASKERLLAQDAVDRAICKDGDGTPHGVEGPLAWALTLD